MKNAFIYFLFILSISFSLKAQKEAANWYFGVKAGLDFNSGSPVMLSNGELNTAEGCTTISDKNGNLLFYTDGRIVYDKSHNVMPNGFGLLGHNSSTQSAIIVPKPSNPNLYYIFTVDQPLPADVDDNPLNDVDPPNNGLNYSLVDLRLNNGLGDVSPTEKNISLITYDQNNDEDIKYKCSEKITAVQHSDGISFWVITHFKNTFYSFSIGVQGINKNAVKSATPLNVPTGGYLSNAIGYLKTSPNGKKIAIANSALKPNDELGPKNNIIRNTGNVWLYDFDNTTGKVSNGFAILNASNPYGIEFSAKSKKLYVTTNLFSTDDISLGSSLFQYDLKSPNIAASKILINSSNYVAGALQLALDEKIYRSGYPVGSDGNNKISVINNPELDGSNCNYIQNAVDLNLGKAKLGLPPFITSLFLYAFSYEYNCFGQNTHFFINSIEKIDTVIWDFGDGTTSTSIDAYHAYVKPGDYKVTLIKTVNGEDREPLEKIITIYEAPKILKTPYKLVQCDTQDDNATDGLSMFNLNVANEPITFGREDYEVYYYNSVNEAQNDENNNLGLPVNYRNKIPDEVIFAKVTQLNSSCYSIASVVLHANKSITLMPEAMHECDQGDGKGTFDLKSKKSKIFEELNLEPDVKLYFFATLENALSRTNELSETYSSKSTTIYIIADNNEGCYGSGIFKIMVEQKPNVAALENLILCEGGSNSPLTLNAGISMLESSNDFTYSWSTGETSSSILVSKEGEYDVFVKNKAGCVSKKKCIVTISPIAKIKNLIIHDLQISNEVIIEVDNSNNYRFMLLYENGAATTFQDSPIFNNVPGGIHRIVVENKDGCGQAAKTFAVLDAPKYFTPNGDGYNEYWNLKGIKSVLYKNAKIYIFDRYGKLLKELTSNSEGWDGTYNGAAMPSDDYWYTAKLEDGREAKGHFSLKR